MFTGIIENLGTVVAINHNGSNLDFWIESTLASELKIDQSVAHEGVCLTVVEIQGNTYKVTAIDETLKKTTLSSWVVGKLVNLERCMQFGARVDGHMVYGHVDAVGECKSIKNENGSTIFEISFPQQFSNLLVEKGSISLNGTSLTVFEVQKDSFKVAIIPYTFEHTSIKKIEIDSKINLEFDIFGKYVEKYLRST
jgi:riboflavin synthase